MRRTAVGSILLAIVVIGGMAVPAIALSTDASDSSPAATQSPSAAQSNASVNVTVGQQLSTVIDASSDDVQTDFENTAFELSVENDSVEAQAEAISERGESLRERAEEITEDYEDATEAYADGEITRSDYAQRLASLNARATNVLEGYDRLQQRAGNVSALELRAAGLNQTALDSATENLSRVTGSGTSALLAQFTGEARGSIELETSNGLSIEIENEDGERSREIERDGDDNETITINQSTALETARANLSTTDTGRWVLTDSSIDHDDGDYEFEFALRDASEMTGEAEVIVDGSSSRIVELEEEIEAREEDEGDDDEREDDDDRDEDDRDDRELALIVKSGTVGPNATVTLQVLADGAPVENATVSLDDSTLGTTDANGTLTVTLPKYGDVELEATDGESDAELEFEFGDEDDEVLRKLSVDTSLDGDTVAVTVRYDGAGVENASVSANDQFVGTTTADGTVTFTIEENATDELELTITKGEFETELEYEIDNGTLSLADSEWNVDDDSDDRDEEDEDRDEEDEDRDEEDKEDEEDEEDEEDDEDDDDDDDDN